MMLVSISFEAQIGPQNNFKRFKKYPDTFRLIYDQGETSNQHPNHYERI